MMRDAAAMLMTRRAPDAEPRAITVAVMQMLCCLWKRLRSPLLHYFELGKTRAGS